MFLWICAALAYHLCLVIATTIGWRLWGKKEGQTWLMVYDKLKIKQPEEEEDTE